MDNNIMEYYCYLKSIYSIDPEFIVNFQNNDFKASCTYDNTEFNVMLSEKDVRHIDSDHLYFDCAILLLQRINEEITKYNSTYNYEIKKKRKIILP